MEEGPLFFFSAENPLSNHYPREFTVRGMKFFHMEGFIMFCKAMLFNDKRTAEKILLTKPPNVAKHMGREVEGFIDEVWQAHCEEYAYQGNLAKFGQHRDLQMYLVGTGGRELVEASPWDRVWGIGMRADDPNIANRMFWGKNRQGRVLMRVRDHFR